MRKALHPSYSEPHFGMPEHARGIGTIPPPIRRRLYFVWRKMVARCTSPSDPAFARYGGRGIAVDEPWLVFANFLVDVLPGYAPGLTLDRRDNDGPYSANNCGWATRHEQQANTRKTVAITFEGETLPIREWARRTGLHHSVIARRLKRGLAPEAILRRAAHARLTGRAS